VHLGSKEPWVIEFKVFAQTIDAMHPPDFQFEPRVKDWRNYGALVFEMMILPYDTATSAEVLLQVSAGKTAGEPSPPYSFNIHVPTGKVAKVSVPVDKLKFMTNIGAVTLGAMTTPGVYLISEISLSKYPLARIEVQEAGEPNREGIPMVYSIGLTQGGAFYDHGYLYYRSSQPLSLMVKSMPAPREGIPQRILCWTAKSDTLLQANLFFDRAQIVRMF